MPWGRIDDAHWRHRKLAALDDEMRKACIGLFWLAVSWCNDNLSDGVVSMTALRQLDGSCDEADELVRVGLWERADKGYLIHDFLDFNKSKAQVEQDRLQRTMAGKAGAAARWSDGESHSGSLSGSPSEMDGGMHGGEDAPLPVTRTPVVPKPATVARDGLPHIDDEAVRFLEGLTGKPIVTAGQKQLAEYDRQLEAHGIKAVVSAYSKVARTMKAPTARQVVWSALRILEPFVSPQDMKRLDEQERVDEERQAHRNRLDATRRRIAEYQGGDAA